jgi:hypothetical protein
MREAASEAASEAALAAARKATLTSSPVRVAGLVALALLVAALVPARRAIGQSVAPVALQSTLSDTRHPPSEAAGPTSTTLNASRAPEPLDTHTPYGEAPSTSRLPLYGALAGAVILGGYAMSDCVKIGCTTAAPMVLAAGAGAITGALVGTVIQRLRARPFPGPTDRPYSLVPRRTSKIALRLHEGHSSHSRWR